MENFEDTQYIQLIPEVDGIEEEDIIRISKRAIEKVREIRMQKNVPDEYYLRVQTRGSNLKGLGFYLVFDANITDYDRILKSEAIEILIDAKTLFYLMGYVIDYKVIDGNEGFVFFIQGNLKGAEFSSVS